VVAIHTDEAFGTVKARATERGVTAATRVVGLVAGRALPCHTLTGVGVEAVRVNGAAHTGGPLVAHDAVRLSPTAARVVRRIAGSAGVIHTLLAVAVTISPTPETLTTICGAERRVSIAAVVIIGVAGEARFVDALTVATISVGLTGHAAAPVG